MPQPEVVHCLLYGWTLCGIQWHLAPAGHFWLHDHMWKPHLAAASEGKTILDGHDVPPKSTFCDGCDKVFDEKSKQTG